MRGFNIDI